MKIYIALIKTDDNKPFKLVIRDEAREMKEYLLSIPVMHSLQSLSVYDSQIKQVEYYSLRDLVEFLKD